jgi:acyl carrier protein
LQIDEVGIHDNFFELGGHSLLAGQVASQLQKVFNINFPTHEIFASSTVAKLELAVNKLEIAQVESHLFLKWLEEAEQQ